jgi:hypothetical protein
MYDSGVLTGFCTLSVVRYSKEHDKVRFGNGVYICPHVKSWEISILFSPLERAISNHWTTYVSKLRLSLVFM